MLKLIPFLILVLSSLGATTLSEPIGSFDNGTLLNAKSLPEEGDGYIHIFRQAGHYWGTDSMLEMITNTAAYMNKNYPDRDRLQVEDISAKNGGDIEPHGSHENGLDVDLGYYKVNGVEHVPRGLGFYAPPMVIDGKVSSNFDVERNWELMKSLHKFGDVQRIFVDRILKKELCNYAKSTNDYLANVEVLRSLRHVAYHEDHLHVRLRCPRTAKRCLNQAELPKGSGCP